MKKNNENNSKNGGKKTFLESEYPDGKGPNADLINMLGFHYILI